MASAAVRIEGQVQAGGGALAGSTVRLYAAGADAPTRLGEAQTEGNGHLVLSNDQTPGQDQILNVETQRLCKSMIAVRSEPSLIVY